MPRAIVRFVNTTPAKYSLEVLPGDAWETRRTKQIARAILRAKNKRSLTTEQLAERCSKFLGEPGAVKTATLNGLFAGKRKAISATELTMFAKMLGVPSVDLLYPLGEDIEVRPGVFQTSSEALAQDLSVSLPSPGGELYLFLSDSRTEALLNYLRAETELVQKTIDAIGALHRWPGVNTIIQPKLQMLKWVLSEYQTAKGRLESIDDRIPPVRRDLEWAADLNPNVIEGDGAKDLLLAIEPQMEGWSSGDYELRAGAMIDGEHQEEA